MVNWYLSSDLDPPWDCQVIVRDIKALLARCSASLVFVPREANFSANFLARFSLSHGCIHSSICLPEAFKLRLLDKL